MSSLEERKKKKSLPLPSIRLGGLCFGGGFSPIRFGGSSNKLGGLSPLPCGGPSNRLGGLCSCGGFSPLPFGGSSNGFCGLCSGNGFSPLGASSNRVGGLCFVACDHYFSIFI